MICIQTAVQVNYWFDSVIDLVLKLQIGIFINQLHSCYSVLISNFFCFYFLLKVVSHT